MECRAFGVFCQTLSPTAHTRVLIADDSATARTLLERALLRAGYEPVIVANGTDALDLLEGDDAPALGILDWMMPDLDGPEICKRVRARKAERYTYLILLTAKSEKEDIVAGLEAGADDFLQKPFDEAELRVRLRVGERVLALERDLHVRVGELQDALDHVKQLQGIIPICMHCKRIRDDHEAWHQLEAYFAVHADAQFTHTLCRECLKEHYPQVGRGEEE
jgi:phosphoserine phosphatase RsbU/P